MKDFECKACGIVFQAEILAVSESYQIMNLKGRISYCPNCGTHCELKKRRIATHLLRERGD